MTTKSRLIRALEMLPDDASHAEILDCVEVIVDLDQAAEDLAAGDTITHEEALKRIRQWFK